MTLPKELQDKWDEAQRTGESVDVGDIVVCDFCEADYTNSNESGGFIFGSYAVCPACAEEELQSIKNYNEEHIIKAFCPPDKSFADFIRDYYGSRHIQVTKND